MNEAMIREAAAEMGQGCEGSAANYCTINSQPERVLSLTVFFGAIVAWVTDHLPEGDWLTNVPCRRRLAGQPAPLRCSREAPVPGSVRLDQRHGVRTRGLA